MRRTVTALSIALAILSMSAANCNRTPEEPAVRPNVEAPTSGSALDPIHTYQPANARLSAPRPATVSLPDTADVTAQLAEDDDREAVLTLEFEHMAEPPDFGLVVFINSPAANLDTPLTDPGYLGSIAFSHTEGDEPEATIVQLPARNAIERSDTEGPLSITLVPVPFPNAQISPQAIDLTATIAVVHSPAG
jgi:hypothetical protein